MRHFLVRAFVLILILFGSFSLHELGHFAVFRFFGTGVDRFQVGFGPQLLHVKGDTTDVVFAALPFGGFVKPVSADTRVPHEERVELGESRPQRLTMLLDRNQSSEQLSHTQWVLVLLAGPVVHGAIAWSAFALIWSSEHRRPATLRVAIVYLPVLVARLIGLEVIRIFTLGRFGRTAEREESLLRNVGIVSSMSSPGFIGHLHMIALANSLLLVINLFIPVPPLDGGKIALELSQICFGKLPKHQLVWINAVGWLLFVVLLSATGLLRQEPKR